MSKGTFTYSAPEQFDSQSFGKVDWQTDIFQIGVMLYEMLSGENPFQGDDMAQVLGNVINHEPESLCSLDQSIPPELDSIVMKALSKRKEERWGSADVMLYGIRQLAEGKPITVDLSRGDGVGKGEGEKHAGWKVPEGAGRANTCPECGNYITPENRKLRCKSCQGYVCQECESWIDKEESYRGFHLHMRYPLCEECYLMELVNHKDHIGELVEEDERKKREASMREQRKREWEKWYGLVTPGNAVERQNIWAETMDVPVNYTDIFGTEFVLIPPGEFFMGSPDWDELAEDDEKPQHPVRITKSFYMGVYEVTVAQFREFVEATNYRTQREYDGKESGWNADAKTWEPHPDWPNDCYSWKNPGFERDESHPVFSLTWTDANEFCRWLSEKEGAVYRLPTDAEWEYACRAGTPTLYACGNDPMELVTMGNVYDLTFRDQFPGANVLFARDGYLHTAPVGKFEPNSFGLFDMHGNVSEWCLDSYDAEYYSKVGDETPAIDPKGPPSGDNVICVERGGHFLGGRPDIGCRSAHRMGRHRSQSTFGFRVVREL